MTTYHVSLSVRGALRRACSPKGLLAADGTRLTDKQARDALMDELAKGHELLLIAPPAECPGFDFKTGCPGHPHSGPAPAEKPT